MMRFNKDCFYRVLFHKLIFKSFFCVFIIRHIPLHNLLAVSGAEDALLHLVRMISCKNRVSHPQILKVNSLFNSSHLILGHPSLPRVGHRVVQPVHVETLGCEVRGETDKNIIFFKFCILTKCFGIVPFARQLRFLVMLKQAENSISTMKPA